jgi:hypothetical protein
MGGLNAEYVRQQGEMPCPVSGGAHRVFSTPCDGTWLNVCHDCKEVWRDGPFDYDDEKIVRAPRPLPVDEDGNPLLNDGTGAAK